MILYFSETGHTKKATDRLHKLFQLPIQQLKPAVAYTTEDLNWQVDNCRANREQRGEIAPPDLAEKIDLGQTEVLFLGFPLWWGIPPKIVDVFLQSHNLDNIKVLPFCTSGSSPIGEAEKHLGTAYPNVNWGKGLRFSDALTDEKIRSWADAAKN